MSTPGLEGVVRPFETGDIQPAKTPSRGETTTADAPNNLVLEPGKGGNVKTLSGSFSVTITFYAVNKPKEKKKPANP